ncbi:MAG: hypothetical protein JWR52_3682 [Marmoricola sp.]|nr:hypothetical protein [Marmoricola sp.]
MKKLVAIGAAALVAMFMAVGLAPAASAYPEAVCNLVVSPTVVHPGDVVTVHCSLQTIESPRLAGRSAASADTHWVVTFDGLTHTGTGESFTTHFTAPQVSSSTVFSVHSVGHDTVTGVKCDRSVNVTDVPGGTVVSPPTGGLPNTGGPGLILLVLGVCFVLGGGIAIQRSRKGHHAQSQPQHRH